VGCVLGLIDMSIKQFLSIVIIWVLCGYLTTGMAVAFFVYHYPNSGNSVRQELGESMFPCLFGPLGTLAIWTFTGFAEHGMCWTDKSCEPIRQASRRLREIK